MDGGSGLWLSTKRYPYYLACSPGFLLGKASDVISCNRVSISSAGFLCPAPKHYTKQAARVRKASGQLLLVVVTEHPRAESSCS